MTNDASGYRKTHHCNNVLTAAREAGVRLSALAVLTHLCRWSKRERPICDDAVSQIQAGTGLCDKTVKAALSHLRALGVIVPVDGCLRRGRGLGNQYWLKVIAAESREKTSPLSITESREEFSEKQGRIFPKSREKTSPLHDTHKSFHADERRGAGHTAAGPNNGPLGAGGSVGTSLKPVAPQDVRALLSGWGFDRREIDGFGHREVIALLRAEGFRLAG